MSTSVKIPATKYAYMLPLNYSRYSLYGISILLHMFHIFYFFVCFLHNAFIYSELFVSKYDLNNKQIFCPKFHMPILK